MTVDKFIPGTFTYEKVGEKYVLTGDVSTMVIAHEGSKKYIFEFILKKGFQTDGASVPKIFSWFVPAWSDNMAYNMAAMIHDAMYGEKGYGFLSREQCDDIFRGALRMCGISRFRAGVVDKCIEWFAGGSSHWGHVEPNAGKTLFNATTVK